MTGTLQPLDSKFAIVDRNGNPTDYFIRWAQQKQIDIGSSITLTDLANYLAAHPLIAGTGIQFTPDGNIADGVNIHADVQAILDEITATRGAVIYRGLLGWAALLPDTAGKVLSTNGAGADPSWITPAAGGGGATMPTVRNTRTTAVSASASIVVPFPTGTIAGDVVIIIATQDNACNTPAGWSSLDNQSGSWIGGMVCAKVMTAADILTGSVTIGFSGSGNGAVCMISIVGTTMNGIGGFFAQRAGAGSGSGVASLAIAQIAQLVTDLVIVFTGNRANSTNAVSNCTAYSTLNTNQSVFFGAKTAQAKFGFNETATFSVAGTGYYVVVLAVR